jgi:hypothetical protein
VLDRTVCELRENDYCVVGLDASRWLVAKDTYRCARVFRFSHDAAEMQILHEYLAESLYGQCGVFDDTFGAIRVRWNSAERFNARRGYEPFYQNLLA